MNGNRAWKIFIRVCAIFGIASGLHWLFTELGVDVGTWSEWQAAIGKALSVIISRFKELLTI